MYEIFEHTADVGVRVRAATREELLVDAARGLFSLLVEDVGAVRPVREIRFHISGTSIDDLLLDWLGELLFCIETERLLLAEFSVCFVDGGVEGTARGEPFDPARHRLDHEVKAVTYHGLAVSQTDDGWFAEVILDI